MRRGVSSTPMGRTNIVIDDELVERVMRRYGLKTKREAVDFALRRVAGPRKTTREEFLALEGSGYSTDISELRPGWQPSERDSR